jgi:hypothetical protein
LKIQGLSKDALKVLDIIKNSTIINLTKEELDTIVNKEYEHIDDTKFILRVLNDRGLIYTTSKGYIELV